MHCTVSTEADASTEIRTKVFRIGAPLLRSTIPVCLGTPRQEVKSARGAPPARESPTAAAADDGGDSDVETVLSLSDVEFEEEKGSLQVTLDFPC